MNTVIASNIVDEHGHDIGDECAEECSGGLSDDDRQAILRHLRSTCLLNSNLSNTIRQSNRIAKISKTNLPADKWDEEQSFSESIKAAKIEYCREDCHA